MMTKRVRETPEVVDGVARMIRGVGKRAGADVDALPLLAGLGELVEEHSCARRCRAASAQAGRGRTSAAFSA